MRIGKTPQNINEELNKMRRLMNFDISQNSHDVLSESNIEKSVLSEQRDKINYESCLSPKETAFKLQNKLNNLLVDKLKEIKEKIPIGFKGDFGTKLSNSKIFLIFPDDNNIELNWSSYWQSFKRDNLTGVLGTPIGLYSLTETLFGDKEMGECFKKLYDNFPVISNQLNSDKLQLNFKNVEFRVFPQDKRPKGKKLKPNKVNLYDFDNPFSIKIKKPFKFLTLSSEGVIELKRIELSGAELLPDTWITEKTCECEDVNTGEMIKYPCDGPLPPECQPDIFTPIELKLDLVDAYKFDQVENADGTSFWYKDGGNQFQRFIDNYADTKETYSMVWDDYLKFLSDKGVTVEGYASIDADEDENMRGEYKNCNIDKQLSSDSKKQPRRDYNVCLSQKRAEQVIKDIVSIYPELDGILKPKGMGATDKFNGKSWPNSNEDETAPNRRVRAVFPVYKTKIKD